MPASPARRAAFRVIRRVFEQEAFADQALHAEAEGLDARERAFARQLAFGTVQRRRALDHVIDRLAKGKLDPPVRAALRLGVFQLLFLDGVPPHAAVAESVELVKRSRGSGLVNAVLRRATREGEALLAEAPEAVRESYPDWLAELWRDAYGADHASQLMRRLNEPSELALRANRLRTTPQALAAAIGGTVSGAESPDAVLPGGPFDAHGHPLWHQGHYMPMSRSSQRVAAFLDPQPGERVLDLCAAPGGKSTHLAALMGDQGQIVSVEQHPDRAEQLRTTAARMGATIVDVHVGDAAEPRDDGPFDRVLADPPCSGLGTLQARPDLRWRMTPERIAGLVDEQRGILRAALGAVRPGGVVVWSTCTLDPAENEELLRDVPGFDVSEVVTLFPHETGSAGFELSRLVSRGR